MLGIKPNTSTPEVFLNEHQQQIDTAVKAPGKSQLIVRASTHEEDT